MADLGRPRPPSTLGPWVLGLGAGPSPQTPPQATSRGAPGRRTSRSAGQDLPRARPPGLCISCHPSPPLPPVKTTLHPGSGANTRLGEVPGTEEAQAGVPPTSAEGWGRTCVRPLVPQRSLHDCARRGAFPTWPRRAWAEGTPTPRSLALQPGLRVAACSWSAGP